MFNMVILSANFIIIILITLAYVKIRKVHLKQYYLEAKVDSLFEKKADELFCQIESLIALYIDLGLKKSLPMTRGWAGSPDFLLKLSSYALNKYPQTVVECSSGISTLVIARCLQINGSGHVYSLDHDPIFAQKTRENLERHGLSSWATVFDSPLKPHNLNKGKWMWYSTEALPDLEIDMLVIDGPPMSVGPLSRYPAGAVFFPKMKAGGKIFLDDFIRSGEREIVKRWELEFPAFIFEEIETEKGLALITVTR